jgi:hypothetical protein
MKLSLKKIMPDTKKLDMARAIEYAFAFLKIICYDRELIRYYNQIRKNQKGGEGYGVPSGSFIG